MPEKQIKFYQNVILLKLFWVNDFMIELGEHLQNHVSNRIVIYQYL